MCLLMKISLMSCLQTGKFTAGYDSSEAVQPDTEAASQQGAGGEDRTTGTSEGHSQPDSKSGTGGNP